MKAASSHGVVPRLSRLRHAPLWLAFSMLLLGLAVVGWGLRDKLSLYAPPGVAAPVAKAKILSQRERPAAQVAVSEPQPPHPLPFDTLSLIAALLYLLSATAQQSLHFPEHEPDPVQRFCSPALRRRPPPTGARPFASALLFS